MKAQAGIPWGLSPPRLCCYPVSLSIWVTCPSERTMFLPRPGPQRNGIYKRGRSQCLTAGWAKGQGAQDGHSFAVYPQTNHSSSLSSSSLSLKSTTCPACLGKSGAEES